EAARVPFSRELSPSLSGLQHHGFLAPLAYFAVDLAARLSIYSPGREPAWGVDDLPKPGDHHAPGRTVARGKLEFRDLGRIPRRAAQRGKGFPRQPARPGGMVLAVPGEGHSDVRPSPGQLGLLSRRRPYPEPADTGSDVLASRRAHAASALARRAGSGSAGSGSGGREVRMVRADHASARVGVRHSAGGNVPLPGSFRGDRRIHSVHLLPVLDGAAW